MQLALASSQNLSTSQKKLLKKNKNFKQPLVRAHEGRRPELLRQAQEPAGAQVPVDRLRRQPRAREKTFFFGQLPSGVFALFSSSVVGGLFRFFSRPERPFFNFFSFCSYLFPSPPLSLDTRKNAKTGQPNPRPPPRGGLCPGKKREKERRKRRERESVGVEVTFFFSFFRSPRPQKTKRPNLSETSATWPSTAT